MQKKSDRRTFLAAVGATATTVALAGCSSGGDDGSDDSEDGSDGSDGGDSNTIEAPDDVDSYLTENDARLYDGTAVDERGSDSVSVAVGAGEIGFAYDPSAVVVSPGTEVVWEWTGEGGAHNVVAAEESDADFTSGDAEAGSDVTYSRTFENTGTYQYYCTPHQANGKHGAVIVRES